MPPETPPRTPGLLLPATLWQGLRLEWLWVYEGRVPETGVWSQEITVPSGVFWVLEGRGQVRTGSCTVEVRPGQCFLSAPGTRRQWFAPGTRLLSVGLRFEHPGGLPVFQQGLNLRLSSQQSAPLRRASLSLLRQTHGRRREVPYRQALLPRQLSLAEWAAQEAAFHLWFTAYLACLQRHGVRPQAVPRLDARLEIMLRRLEAWPLAEPLCPRRLATGTGLGERRAHDLLRQHLGLTAQAWLDRRRAQAARQQLSAGTTALKEVAASLGFRHPPHFTAWFKRHTGLTPTAFRAAGGGAA